MTIFTSGNIRAGPTTFPPHEVATLSSSKTLDLPIYIPISEITTGIPWLRYSTTGDSPHLPSGNIRKDVNIHREEYWDGHIYSVNVCNNKVFQISF